MATKRRIMVKAKLDEISAVDKPAMPDAKAVLRKRADDDTSNESLPADSAASLPAGENTTMTPEQIEALTKRAERAENVLTLTNAERELFTKMNEADQDAFLSLSTNDRAEQVTKAADADPIVYTDGKGREFRKSADPLVVELAKDADEARKERAESEKLGKMARISKRAGELSNLPGDSDTKVLLVEAVEKMEPEQRTKLDELLTSLNTDLAKAFTRVGTTAAPVAKSNSPMAKLEELAKAVKAAEPTLTDSQAFNKALHSDEGKALYNEHLDAAHA